MKKEDFFEKLIDTLELENEDIDYKTKIHLDSLSTLSVIVFLHENFNKRVSAEELKKVSSVKDIVKIVGKDKII